MSWTDRLTSAQHDALVAALNTDGAEHLHYASGDRDFARFMFAADLICRRRLGVSVFDLEDACWRDFHADGLTPYEALRAARENT
jgi:hypothetical protein